MDDRELASRKLQLAICDAMCAPEKDTREGALRWIASDRFVACCSILGVDWVNLRVSLGEAAELPEPAKELGRHLSLIK
jgi:hypothetical protein